MKNLIRRMWVAAALLTIGASLGNASSISYWVDVFSTLSTTAVLCPGGVCPDHTLPPTLATGGGPSVTLTIPQFNSGGNAAEGTPSANHIFTLTSVALALDWAATGNVTVYNFFNANIPFNNAFADTQMTLTAGGNSVTAHGIAASGPNTAPFGTILNGSPIFLGSITFGSLTGSGNDSALAANLIPFLGGTTFTGTLAANAVNVTGTSSDAHANQLAYQGDGQMGAIATITYNYTETLLPEPVTFALVGGALVGLGLIGRKRFRKV